MKILTRLHQACRKFINISPDRVAVLTDQNYFIMILTVNTVDDHAIRVILPCRKLHIFYTLRSGSHKIRNRCVMYTGRIHSVKIHEFIVCKFFYTVDLTHLKKAPSEIFYAFTHLKKMLYSTYNYTLTAFLLLQKCCLLLRNIY